LAKCFPERAAHGGAALLLVAQVAAELDARPALGLAAREPRTLEVVGAQLDVRAQLLVHLGVGLAAAEQPRAQRAERRDEAHASRGCGGRTAAIAVARRFQPWVSCRRRPRPAAVSS